MKSIKTNYLIGGLLFTNILTLAVLIGGNVIQLKEVKTAEEREQKAALREELCTIDSRLIDMSAEEFISQPEMKDKDFSELDKIIGDFEASLDFEL